MTVTCRKCISAENQNRYPHSASRAQRGQGCARSHGAAPHCHKTAHVTQRSRKLTEQGVIPGPSYGPLRCRVCFLIHKKPGADSLKDKDPSSSKFLLPLGQRHPRDRNL